MRAVSSLPPTRASGFLRPEPSRFFGRGEDLDRLDAPFEVERLVTIVGAGGIGKTRLAMRYATTRRARFGSAWFCDMRDARTSDEMAHVVLRAFGGARVVQSGDADAVLMHTLVARPDALVILDNVEHLVPCCAAVIRGWMAAAPDVRFLVTSRVPLGVPREHIVELGGVSSRDAVELFVERVRERMIDWLPEGEERASIAELARRLAGVPLAIEIAAARVGSDDPRDVLALVSARPAPAEVALRRAFDLLAPVERELLRRCSSFRGSFTLQAIDAVAADVDGAREVAVLLAGKSLLRVERHGPMRFSMCEAIRALSESTLRRTESEALAVVHATFFCERARAIGRDESELEPGADDWEDLEAALAWGVAHKRFDVVLHTALALDALALGGGLGEARLAELDAALRAGAAADLDLLARALLARASTLYALGRLVESRRDAETAVTLADEVGGAKRAREAHRAAAQAAFQLGEFDTVRKHLTRAFEIESDRGDARGTASVLRHLGSLHNSLGELDLAQAAFEKSLKLVRSAGDGAGEAFAFMGLAWNYFERDECDLAGDTYDRALAAVRRLKMLRSERIVVGYMGVLELYEGRLSAAEDHLTFAALASRRGGDLRVAGIFEGVRGGVLAALDRIAESRASFDLADELLAGNAFYRSAVAVYRGLLDLAESRAASAEGHEHAARAHVANARWRIEEAHALARSSDDARMAIKILEHALARAG
ncbi:MAG TPA: tetratricopeptide repeat protein [Polyangiaceae bacterium]